MDITKLELDKIGKSLKRAVPEFIKAREEHGEEVTLFLHVFSGDNRDSFYPLESLGEAINTYSYYGLNYEDAHLHVEVELEGKALYEDCILNFEYMREVIADVA